MFRNKIKKLAELKKIIKNIRKQEKKIVFTNGCFDILHVGHLRLLEQGKRLGDCLIVAVNADRSIKKIKGSLRPVQSELDRAELCAGLKPVDYVIIFKEETPACIIKELKPDILVKGGDWKENSIVGRDVVKKVVRVPLVKGRSTSAIINKIKKDKKQDVKRSYKL